MTAPTQPAPLDLDALQTLHQAATLGPWRIGVTMGRNEDKELAYLITTTLPYAETGITALVCEIPDRDADRACAPALPAGEHDAAFIVSAHKNMPALLAEARENRTSRDRIAELERENAELMKALYEAERLADDRGREHTAAFMEDTSDGRHAVAAAECAHIAEGIKALRAARLVSEPHGVKAPDHG